MEEKGNETNQNNVIIDVKNVDVKKGFRKRLFEIIELAESGDTVSAIYDVFMIITIIVSLTPLAFKQQDLNNLFTNIFKYSDYTVTVIFIIDYFFRYITADYKLNQKSVIAFIKYPITPWAIVDLLSILPSLTILYEGLKILRVINLIKTLRIIRAFKTFRYNKSIIIIYEVIKKSKKPLIAVGSLAIGYILISALIIFNVEPEPFETFFDAVYWATVSLTTVGYGDIYPQKVEGRVIAMISSMCGIALVALPAGVITAGYMDSLNTILENKIGSSKNLVNKNNNDNDNIEKTNNENNNDNNEDYDNNDNNKNYENK